MLIIALQTSRDDLRPALKAGHWTEECRTRFRVAHSSDSAGKRKTAASARMTAASSRKREKCVGLSTTKAMTAAGGPRKNTDCSGTVSVVVFTRRVVCLVSISVVIVMVRDFASPAKQCEYQCCLLFQSVLLEDVFCFSQCYWKMLFVLVSAIGRCFLFQSMLLDDVFP